MNEADSVGLTLGIVIISELIYIIVGGIIHIMQHKRKGNK